MRARWIITKMFMLRQTIGRTKTGTKQTEHKKTFSIFLQTTDSTQSDFEFGLTRASRKRLTTTITGQLQQRAAIGISVTALKNGLQDLQSAQRRQA